MNPSMDQRLADVPLRNAKAKLRGAETKVQKLNPAAGQVLEAARAAAKVEPKAMADAMDVSHSYVLRGLKSQDDLGFHKLWALSDEFWFELACLVLESRGVGRVRRLFEVERERKRA